MHEVKNFQENNVNSLSLFIGKGECNANCFQCAGAQHRKYAPKEDGIIDKDLIENTLRTCNKNGARNLSISSSGEPTLSPESITKTLSLVNCLKKEGIIYENIHLYSNGIRIGEDKEFCSKYLGIWKELGLDKFYITVHDANEKKNSEFYRVSTYPKLSEVVNRIHDNNISVRANIVLSKRNISTLEKYSILITDLFSLGIDSISSWPIRGLDDKVDSNLSPEDIELDKIEEWIYQNYKDIGKVKLLRETNRIVYENREKLTLFPDGSLSNTWCNYKG